MIRMKALTTFRGQDAEGRPKKGTEFEAASDPRADELERHGLARRIGHQKDRPLETKVEPPLQNKMEEPPANKGPSSELPLSQAGGPTGADAAPSSSPPGPARPRRQSRARKGEQE